MQSNTEHESYREVAIQALRNIVQVGFVIFASWAFIVFILFLVAVNFPWLKSSDYPQFAILFVAFCALIYFSASVDSLENIKDSARKNARTLATKRFQMITKNEYGILDRSKWDGEMTRFIEMHGVSSIGMLFRPAERYVEKIASEFKLEHAPETAPGDGIAYEHQCRSILEEKGWAVIPTPASGDRGIDLIAVQSGVKVAIQCKNYQSPVGAKAVQEIFTGSEYERADFAIVVAPVDYTRQAKEMASTLGVMLIHTDELFTLYERVS